jgi:hypothetical protein
MLQPHKGYVSEWDRSTTGIPGYDAVPQPRRCNPTSPMPAWWDVDKSDIWSAGAAGAKRAAVDSRAARNDGAEVAAAGQVSPAAQSSGRAALASDDPTPNGLYVLANESWDIVKDLVPGRRLDSAPVKGRSPAERETKRPRLK